MIGVGVIGYGYWGPNLVRNFKDLSGVRLVGVCDQDSSRLEDLPRRYPGVWTTTETKDLIDHPAVDAVAIATPVASHFPLALLALQAGKHVLVEKPLTATVEQAQQLIEEAQRQACVLMVDHTFLYTGAVRKIRELVRQDDFGTVQYYDSVRVNLGLFRHDVSVLWDLAVHDLAILDYVVPLQPRAVSATGMQHVPGQPENIAYLTLFFDGPLIAHVHVNWLAPVKVRRTLIGGSRRMIVYDDLEPSDKVKVYDKGITLDGQEHGSERLRVAYRCGDMWAPQLDLTEALHTELQHFIQSVERGSQPISDGPSGLRVVQVLEAATESLARRGQVVEVERAEVCV